jgi:hypothetical protein
MNVSRETSRRAAALEKTVSRETSKVFRGRLDLKNAILQNNPMH